MSAEGWGFPVSPWMLASCERGRWDVMDRAGEAWGRMWVGTRQIFASVTNYFCGWHCSLLFIARTLHTCSGAALTLIQTEVGKSAPLQHKWAGGVLILFYYRVRGHLEGFSHELLITQKPAILCMSRCSYSMNMVWLRNTFIEITVFFCIFDL